MSEMQQAKLSGPDATNEYGWVSVPAFPNNPDVIKTPDNKIYIASYPTASSVSKVLYYHEVVVYDVSA